MENFIGNNGKTAFGKIFLLIMLLSIGTYSLGQKNHGFSLSGTVVDSVTRQPLEYASVAIYQTTKPAPLAGIFTNDKGEFVFPNLDNGIYNVKINFIGFKAKTENFAINNSSVKLSEPILMISSTIYLSEYQVTGELNEKQTSIEKTKINVAQNISALSGNVTEILKSQPSITIDAENNIYLRGNSNILILMDGKPTTIGSLNSIPASNIQNIEIITNPDAKYDAEGTGGIINVITKKNFAGFNAATTLNYGINNRINGGINLNFSKGIWSMGFNYNAKYEISDIHSNLTRLFYQPPTLIEQNIHSKQDNFNQMGSLIISAKPNPKNIITLGANFLLLYLANDQYILGTQTDSTNFNYSYDRRNEISWSRIAFEGSFTYKKIFEKNKK